MTRGFLGDRAAYKGFTMQLGSAGLSWSCLSAATYTPENKACTKSGINVDGAFVTDISRGGSLRWPPGDDGVSYQLESIQGMGLQVELLYRAGYTAAWGWSSKAMNRAAGVVTRSKASGGKGWNETNAARQMPWLLNKRYGTKIPTVESNMGRAIGFTDWLWGAGGGSAPPPTPKPTPAPGSLPVVTTPAVRLSTSSGVPTSGVPAVVLWGLASSSDPLWKYQLQVKIDNGGFSSRTLSSARAGLSNDPEFRPWVHLPRPRRGHGGTVRRLEDRRAKAGQRRLRCLVGCPLGRVMVRGQSRELPRSKGPLDQVEWRHVQAHVQRFQHRMGRSRRADARQGQRLHRRQVRQDGRSEGLDVQGKTHRLRHGRVTGHAHDRHQGPRDIRASDGLRRCVLRGATGLTVAA